jgi:hypothetical protein
MRPLLGMGALLTTSRPRTATHSAQAAYHSRSIRPELSEWGGGRGQHAPHDQRGESLTAWPRPPNHSSSVRSCFCVGSAAMRCVAGTHLARTHAALTPLPHPPGHAPHTTRHPDRHAVRDRRQLSSAWAHTSHPPHGTAASLHSRPLNPPPATPGARSCGSPREAMDPSRA